MAPLATHSIMLILQQIVFRLEKIESKLIESSENIESLQDAIIEMSMKIDDRTYEATQHTEELGNN